MIVRPEPNEGNPLWKYFFHNQGRIIHKLHHHFHRFQNLPATILEIVISKGGSLQMWKNYFDPKAKIYGVDYDSVLVIEKYPNTIKLIATLMGKAG